MTPRETLAFMERELGPTPRDPDAQNLADLRGQETGWALQQDLAIRGEVTWGLIVMANDHLWKPNAPAALAQILFSFDEVFKRRPRNARSIADRLHALYRLAQVPEDPAERHLHSLMYSGMRRNAPHPLPLHWTGGRVIHHATVWVHPDMLPTGYLVDTLVPVLAHRQPDGGSDLIHHAFWPASLRDLWTQRAR